MDKYKLCCPKCGAELGWESSENGYDVSQAYTEEEISTVEFYHCKNCGEDAVFYECPDEDKNCFPFWRKKL